MFFLHEVHKLTDQFGDQQIQRCRDEGYHNGKNDVFEEGEDKISEKTVLLPTVVQSLYPFEQFESRPADVLR